MTSSDCKYGTQFQISYIKKYRICCLGCNYKQTDVISRKEQETTRIVPGNNSATVFSSAVIGSPDTRNTGLNSYVGRFPAAAPTYAILTSSADILYSHFSNGIHHVSITHTKNSRGWYDNTDLLLITYYLHMYLFRELKWNRVKNKIKTIKSQVELTIIFRSKIKHQPSSTHNGCLSYATTHYNWCPYS